MGLSMVKKGLSCLHEVQIKIGSWMQPCPMKCHMLIAWVQKHTQKFGVILGEELTTCLLMYILCLNHQKKHQNFQEMLQSCLKEEMDVPKKVQTMLKLCLIIRCQWVQLGFGHLDNSANEVGWWHALGWWNLEILNMCHQTCLVSWFMLLSGYFQTLPMLGFLVSVQWTHEEIDFPIAYV